MKKTSLILIFLSLFLYQCEKNDMNNDIMSNSLNANNQLKSTAVILNPGFETGFTNWTDVDPSAISGDAYSGSKSAKITGSGGSVSQDISVDANSDYELSAYVSGSWRIGAYISGVKKSRSGDASDWTKETVSFNTGSATSITIFCQYNAGTGRFDDFEIVKTSGSSSSGGTSEITISSVSASSNDGNVPSNTIDGDLGTRWSAKGDGEWILYTFDNTYSISDCNIAWYKGNSRSSNFDVYAGTNVNNLTQVISGGVSSGSSLELENYTFSTTEAKYLKIVGHGNSSNTWNSITEFSISGILSSSGGSTDNTAPAEVSNLSASASDASVSLSWSNPTDADFDHVIITYNGNTLTTSSTSKTITGLTNGTSYTFLVQTVDNSGNVSQGSSVSATPKSTSSGNYPSDILSGLTNWKVTLPVDKNGDDSSDATDVSDRNTNPWEIAGSDLINFEYPPYFYAENGEVVFHAHCAGATTSGSDYPRCELRQEVGGGDNYWSVDDYQYLHVKLRVTHTPVEKPEVCMTQIHGPENEPLRLQYHADKGLYLVWNESNKDYFKSTVSYTLGQTLEVTVVVDNGDITCTVTNTDTNETYTKTWTSNDSTGYFKVGCYTQSSIFLSQFKSGYNDESIDAYGEVRVSQIDLVENY